MTALPEDALAFHLGLVVSDRRAALERYNRLLPDARWWTADSSVARFAFLRAAGVTFELIEPVAPDSVYAEYLRRHGEGVQHIGFWVADVRAAVAAAVADGARVTLARLEGERGMVTIRLGDRQPDLLSRIMPGGAAYLDVGAGGVEFELVGPATEGLLRELLDDEFDRLLVGPAWA